MFKPRKYDRPLLSSCEFVTYEAPKTEEEQKELEGMGYKKNRKKAYLPGEKLLITLDKKRMKYKKHKKKDYHIRKKNNVNELDIDKISKSLTKIILKDLK